MIFCRLTNKLPHTSIMAKNAHILKGTYCMSLAKSWIQESGIAQDAHRIPV